MAVINLENMEFWSYHGCIEEERRIGTKYVISVSLAVDMQQAMASDNLHDTINYQEVYSIIKEEMDIPSNLIEHVAGRIQHRLKERFPQSTQQTISLSKFNPPLGGQIEKVTIVL